MFVLGYCLFQFISSYPNRYSLLLMNEKYIPTKTRSRLHGRSIRFHISPYFFLSTAEYTNIYV